MNITANQSKPKRPAGYAFFTSMAIALIVVSICFDFSFFNSYARGLQRQNPQAVTNSRLTLNYKHITSQRNHTKMMLHTLAASYFSFNETLTATLMLSNQVAHPIQFTATLFSMSGKPLELPPMTLNGNTAQQFSLKEWAASGGPEFSEGSLRVVYIGGPLEVGGLVIHKDIAGAWRSTRS